jgi:hypothetical protein
MEPLPGNTADASSSDLVSTKLERIATLAELLREFLQRRVRDANCVLVEPVIRGAV